LQLGKKHDKELRQDKVFFEEEIAETNFSAPKTRRVFGSL
jgi:hypothetical protein